MIMLVSNKITDKIHQTAKILSYKLSDNLNKIGISDKVQSTFKKSSNNCLESIFLILQFNT